MSINELTAYLANSFKGTSTEDHLGYDPQSIQKILPKKK